MSTVGKDLSLYLDLRNPEEFERHLESIKHVFENNGACVINAWDTEVSTLKRIAALFGHIQGHARSNIDGIVGENEAVDESWKENKNEYQGVTSEEFLPHTDGSFLDGYTIHENRLTHVGPPKVILLQCVTQAEEGGQNYIVDAEKIIADIIENESELLRILLRPGCVSFCRDDLYSINHPVYQKRSDGAFQLRFRYDFATYSPDWAIEAVRHLHTKYHMNPKYRINMTLKPGQILIVNNLKLLHARDAFQTHSPNVKDRKLRRIWIYDENQPRLYNIENKITSHRALTPFSKYKIIHQNEFPFRYLITTGGIHLSYKHDELANILMQQNLKRVKYFVNKNKYTLFASNTNEYANAPPPLTFRPVPKG